MKLNRRSFMIGSVVASAAAMVGGLLTGRAEAKPIDLGARYDTASGRDSIVVSFYERDPDYQVMIHVGARGAESIDEAIQFGTEWANKDPKSRAARVRIETNGVVDVHYIDGHHDAGHLIARLRIR